MEAKLFNSHESVFNHYVASHPNGDVLQTTYWGQLKAMTGWTPLPLAIVDNHQIKASALILKRQIPLPGHCIFYSPRGPLFSNQEALAKLLKAGQQLGKRHHAVLWKMDPALTYGDTHWQEIAARLQKVNSAANFDGVQPKFIMELDIRPPVDTLLTNMKAKTRYNIGYAKRKGVKVVVSKSKADLKLFYPILQETAKRDNFTIRSLEYFEYLWDCLIVPNVAQLFMAYHNEKPLGGTIAFRLGKRAWYVYGASSNQRRNLQASYAIQWEMIRWAKGSGCHIYDFRGIAGDIDPENPLYGLYRFKDGFGAKIVEYVGEFDFPLSLYGYPMWNHGFHLYTTLLKRKGR